MGLKVKFWLVFKASVRFMLNLGMGPFGKGQVGCFKVRSFRGLGFLARISRGGLENAKR